MVDDSTGMLITVCAVVILDFLSASVSHPNDFVTNSCNFFLLSCNILGGKCDTSSEIIAAFHDSVHSSIAGGFMIF